MKLIFLLGLFKLSFLSNSDSSPHILLYKIWAGLLNFLKNLDSRPRIVLSTVVAMSVFLLTPSSLQLDTRLLAGWISGVAFFLAVVLLMMVSSNPQKTYRRAQRQEAQHSAIFLLVILTAFMSVFAIGLMLSNHKDTTPPAVLEVNVVLSALAILCSWFLTHTMFALHYATFYYRLANSNPEVEYAGGLDLPNDAQPDFIDFMYFAFTIGMTSQTSDISIINRPMRRLALGHAWVSFFYYSVILAMSVSIVSGLV
jgi:uncharacterized membrane protein